jgi:hypothetical protein
MGNTSPTPATTPRKRIDKALLQALTATMPFDAEGAAKLVRSMRDDDTPDQRLADAHPTPNVPTRLPE